MIYETPEISNDVKKYLDSDNYRDRPILKNYPNFPDCFVCFHPFLKIKEGHNDQIKFETGNWPNKSEIEKHCEAISWNEIIRLTGIYGIKSLDRALAFYHRAYRFAEKSEYKKLTNLLDKETSNIIPPQVDELPEIIENKLLRKLQTLGYNSVFVYSDIDDKDKLNLIDELITNPNGLRSHVRIETPDSKIIVAQDFDQRFTYILGEKPLLIDIIKSIDLEGFFCDQETPESWSYFEISEKNKMDWDKDMKERNEERNTTHNSTLPKAGRSWWQKLFGS
jgi:hypothetical protein